MSIYACKCGCGFDAIDPRVDEVVNLIKSKLPSTKVNSACRCAAHNKAVGGKESSAHLNGLAADLSCTSSWNRYYLIALLYSKKVRRIGVAQSFIHFDLDEKKPQDVLFFY